MRQALFYPVSLAKAKLTSLVSGLPIDEVLDVVDFAAESGGDARRELAVPLLVGMDDIEVTAARIVLRCGQKVLDVEDYQVRDHSEGGVFLSLPRRSRLRKVELSYIAPTPAPGQTLRLVVRAARKSGNGFEAGSPLFAEPDLGSLGSMFGRVLGGMQVTSLAGNRRLLTFPPLLGEAWLIQLAAGNSATELSPLTTKLTIHRVALDAVPSNLTVTLAGAGGDVKLWNNPEVLLPEAGAQEVSFTPLAQKHLSASLRSQSAGDVALTLSIPLSLHSDTGCAVDITDRALEAEYVLGPLGTEPASLKLRGTTTPLALNAAAGLEPRSSSLHLTVKHLGRELNAASAEWALIPPTAGLRVSSARQIATSMTVAPRSGQAAGSVLELASARVCLAAPHGAEAVLEIRGDLAGAPGQIAGAPVVKSLEPGFSGWMEFEFAKPLNVVAGQAPLWLALRVTTGVVDWFSAPAVANAIETARVSSDEGATWGTASSALMSSGTLLAQLFDAVPEEPPAPALRLSRGSSVLQENLLSSAIRKAPFEYRCETSFPSSVHALLAATEGEGRKATELHLFSRAALDVSVSAQLRYDPFAARARGA